MKELVSGSLGKEPAHTPGPHFGLDGMIDQNGYICLYIYILNAT